MTLHIIEIGKLQRAIKSKLKTSKLSLRQASGINNVSFSAMSRILSKNKFPDVTNYLRLCDWLDKKPGAFMRIKNVKHK